MTVHFIGKDYSIPEDVITYIDLLAFTETAKENLVRAFLNKIKYSIDRIEDNSFLEQDIYTEAQRFIAKLCENGIYNRTVNDYLKNNKGYEFFHTANKDALNRIISLRKARNAAYEAGVQDAIYRKESSVTGLDFGIISGSFVNHMIYASMNASKEKEQEEAALKQYNKEIAELEKSVTSACEASEREYINNIYIPSIKLAFTALVYSWLDSYVRDLIQNGSFDSNALKYTDLERSNDLLKNLSVSSNKTAILETAFSACPYNVDVYMKAMYYDLLDYNSFKTCVVFKQSEEVIQFLRDSWGFAEYPQNFKINYHCVDLLATFTEQNCIDLLYRFTQIYVSNIVDAYNKAEKMLHNEDLCVKMIKGYSIEEILAGNSVSKREANRYITSIVRADVWEQLINNCGHAELFDKIKNISFNGVDISSKIELDNLLIERLEHCFENARQKLIPIANQKKQEYERKEKEEEARTIRLTKLSQSVQTICKFALPALIIIPLVLRFVLVGVWCGNVRDFVNDYAETQLEKELAKSDSYARKMGLTREFEVGKIEYYKEEFIKSITIVPHITVYSSKNEDYYCRNYADTVFRYLNYSDTEKIARPWYIANDEYNPSVNFHITVICEDGSKVTCYKNYEEDDTKIFAYLPFGTLVLFAIYSIAVVIIIKKVKKKYTVENLLKEKG